MSLQEPSRSPYASTRLLHPKDVPYKEISLWRIFLLSAVGGAIDLGYSVEGAYAVPLILATGMPLKYAPLALALSPIMGLLFQTFLGSMSDQCQCTWGRRRPFIAVLAIVAAVGFGSAPNSFYLLKLKLPYAETLVVVGVVSCIILGDFCIGALQLPSRAYLLDSLPPTQIKKGNFVYSVLIGIGQTLGSALGGIKWSLIMGEGVLTVQNQGQIVFGLAALLIIIAMLLTVFSVKERSNHLPDETQPLLLHDTNQQRACLCSPMQCGKLFIHSLKDIFKFVYVMSHQMWLIWLMVYFGFYVLAVYNNFFTVFMGTVVYGGDPHADVGSDTYERYAKGVRIGSWGLALSAILNAILSLVFSRVTRWVSLKTLFLVIAAYFTVCMSLMMYFHQLPVVIVLSTSYGPFFGVVLTVPFTLISIYKVEMDRWMTNGQTDDRMNGWTF